MSGDTADERQELGKPGNGHPGNGHTGNGRVDATRPDSSPDAPTDGRREPGAFRRFARMFGWNGDGTSMRDALEELIEEESEDAVTIDVHERAIIRNVLGLRDYTAQDVMVPRADIVAVEAATPLPDLVSHMAEVAHSRLPVYRETLDDVIGMIHIKDVLRHLVAGSDVPLTGLVREVLFVAPSIRALDLLQQMRMTRHHLALVVDEFGGIDGLITVEDLVEEIVGDITDEHDIEEGPKFVMAPDGTATADARATVEEFEEIFGPVLDEEEREELDTLGGLVFSLAGRIATRGEIIRHPAGIEFEILEADPRRIRTMRVRRTAEDTPASARDGSS